MRPSEGTLLPLFLETRLLFNLFGQSLITFILFFVDLLYVNKSFLSHLKQSYFRGNEAFPDPVCVTVSRVLRE